LGKIASKIVLTTATMIPEIVTEQLEIAWVDVVQAGRECNATWVK
jgi:hypothetical protein